MASRLLVILFTAVVSGCGLSQNQLNETARFADATIELADTAEALFVQIRKDVMYVRAKEKSIARRCMKIVPKSAANGTEFVDPKPGFGMDLEARLRATSSLRTFGSLVKKMTGDARKSEVVKGGIALFTKANSAFDNYNEKQGAEDKKLSRMEKALISEAIGAFGGIWVSYNRKISLRKAMKAASTPNRPDQSPLAQLCRVMEEDLRVEADWDKGSKQYVFPAGATYHDWLKNKDNYGQWLKNLVVERKSLKGLHDTIALRRQAAKNAPEAIKLAGTDVELTANDFGTLSQECLALLAETDYRLEKNLKALAQLVETLKKYRKLSADFHNLLEDEDTTSQNLKPYFDSAKRLYDLYRSVKTEQ